MQSDLKILVIEHENSFSGTVRDLLRQTTDASAEIISASSRDEGMARLKELPFDVTVVQLPSADGAGMADISLVQEAGFRVPVIVVGDKDDERTAVEVVQAGAQDYLVRDQLDARLFARSIRYAIERHRSDMALLDAEEVYRGLFDHLI